MSKFSNLIHLNSLLHGLSRDFLKAELEIAGFADLETCHGDLFAVLFEQSPLPLTELARLCGRSKSTVSVMVNNLVKKGYLIKTKDTPNSRSLRIELSDKGQSLRVVFTTISKKMQDVIDKSLSLKQQREIEQSLSLVVSAFQDLPSKK